MVIPLPCRTYLEGNKNVCPETDYFCPSLQELDISCQMLSWLNKLLEKHLNILNMHAPSLFKPLKLELDIQFSILQNVALLQM